MTIWLWIFCRSLASASCFLWLVSVVSGQTGPSDVTVQQGDDATLTCSRGSPLTSALWLDETKAIADIDGIYPDADAKYNNFAIVKTDTANGQYDLRVQGAQYEDRGEYTCQFGGTALPPATLTVEVPATRLIITVDAVDASSGGTVTVTARVAVTLTCTALGAKPRVSLDWFKGSEPLTPDTETVPPSGEPTDTRSTHDPFIPGRSDDGERIECRTSGHQTTQTKYIRLNVRFAPVTTVGYDGDEITCSSDANPLATSHQIILNGTDVLKSFTNSPGTVDFKPDGCTDISCDAANAIATTTGTFADNPACPRSDVDPTTEQPMTKQPTRDPVFHTPFDVSMMPDAPNVGIIIGPVLGVIVIVAVVAAFCIVLRRRLLKQQGRTNTDGQDGGNPHMREKNVSSIHSNNRASPGQEPHHPNYVPLEQVTTAVVYESIPNDGRVEPEASKGVTYGNVGPALSFSRDLVVIENELGRGAFGRVLLGKALGIEKAGKETKVAVKTLKEGADRQARMELLAELELMKKVGSHPNVVKLLGYCAEKDPVYVIVEYLAKGDLKHVLLEYRDKDQGTGYSNLPGLSKSLSRTLVKFARDVANGMAFISSQKCVHRDLAARNVLVGDDLVCKVSDFGLARDVMNIRIYQRESQGPLPMRWMALESILDDVYTTESDVWSFGILLWEIITLGARPYPVMKTKTMMSQLQQGYRMPKPQHCKAQLYDMMRSCWQKSPKARPTFQSLYQQLEDMLSEDKDYITIHKLDESIYEVTMLENANEKL